MRPGEWPDGDQTFTVEDMAKYLRLDKITVQRACRSGQLPAVRVGKQWRALRSRIDEYLLGPNFQHLGAW